jgi:hypothetical protein
MSRIYNHAWAHAQLADGRTFMAFYLADVDGKAGGHAAVGWPSRMEPAEILTPLPLLTEPADAMASYQFTLGTSSGDLIIHGEPLQIAMCALTGPSELVFGAHNHPSAHHRLLEAQTKFTIGGQTCAGLTDRTVRLPL